MFDNHLTWTSEAGVAPSPVPLVNPIIPPTPPKPRPPGPETLVCKVEPTECKAQRQRLRRKYKRAYDALVREVESYQVLVDDRSCFDTTKATYTERITALQLQQTQYSEEMSRTVAKLDQLKPGLVTLRKSQKELTLRVKTLQQECKAEKEARETLERTKEVIKQMGRCVSVNSAKFKLPLWTGKWIKVDLSDGLKNREMDAMLNQACVAAFGQGARSAEISEVDTGSIKKMPKNNKAGAALIPSCPLCGKASARACWHPKARLIHKNRRNDCSGGGPRAVMCVYEIEPED